MRLSFTSRERRKKKALTEIGKRVQGRTDLLGRSSLGEDAPKTERLVASAGHDRLSAGRHGEVQDAERVASQLGHLDKARVLPEQNLVLGVAVGADELGRVLGPGEVADLGPGVDALHGLAGERVPEADATVRGAAARGQEAVVVRRPGNGLHCCHVVAVRLDL